MPLQHTINISGDAEAVAEFVQAYDERDKPLQVVSELRVLGAKLRVEGQHALLQFSDGERRHVATIASISDEFPRLTFAVALTQDVGIGPVETRVANFVAGEIQSDWRYE